jgi:tripartite-type tricarboxylate transporter receptor subunit TctC
MRTVSEELSRRWGQPIVIENRAGGGMNIGGRACAEAPPDGTTICIMSNEVVTYNQYLYKNPGFDAEKSIAPVTNLFFLTQALVVNSALKVNSLAELAALSKAKPGTLSYSAPAAPLALFMDNFNKENGADLVRVPFKGGGDAVNGVLTGATPITRGPLTRSYFGLYAPMGMPPAFIAKIANDIRSVASEAAFRDKNLIARGLEPVFNTPEEFAQFLRQDRIEAQRVVKDAGLLPQ